MTAPAPVPTTAPRRIAFRQGLLFGGGLGIAALLLNICGVFAPVARRLSFSAPILMPSFSPLVYLLALIAFFFAGWRATQQTGRIDIGALAGFWAGLVGGLVGVVIDIVLLLYTLSSSGPLVSRSSLADLLVALVFEAGMDAILALLFGAGLGALGGIVGRAYASGQAAPAQPNQGPVSSPPAQPPSPPPGQP